MPPLNIPKMLVRIIKAVEYSDFRVALTLFTQMFNHPTDKIPEDCIADVTALLVYIFSKISLLDRAAFVKSIARSKNLPGFLCKRLLKESLMVSSHLVQHGNISDSDLVALIEEGDGERMLTITKRLNLSIPVTDKLATSGDLRVLVGLANNVTARLSRSSFDLMASVATTNVDMDKALAAREDLPPELARIMSRRLHGGSEKRVADLVSADLMRRRGPLVLRGSGG